MCLRCWSPNDPTGKGFLDGRRAVLNAIEWMKTTMKSWVYKDMETLEAILKKTPVPAIPPLSKTSQKSTRKRKVDEISQPAGEEVVEGTTILVEDQ